MSLDAALRALAAVLVLGQPTKCLILAVESGNPLGTIEGSVAGSTVESAWKPEQDPGAPCEMFRPFYAETQQGFFVQDLFRTRARLFRRFSGP